MTISSIYDKCLSFIIMIMSSLKSIVQVQIKSQVIPSRKSLKVRFKPDSSQITQTLSYSLRHILLTHRPLLMQNEFKMCACMKVLYFSGMGVKTIKQYHQYHA